MNEERNAPEATRAEKISEQIAVSRLFLHMSQLRNCYGWGIKEYAAHELERAQHITRIKLLEAELHDALLKEFEDQKHNYSNNVGARSEELTKHGGKSA